MHNDFLSENIFMIMLFDKEFFCEESELYIVDQSTLLYYNTHAEKYTMNTLNVEFGETQKRFLKYIPVHGSILDFGCGSGRDTKYFIESGYLVTAIDGSLEICKLASNYTGLNVKCMMFNELDEIAVYDGIWACSSILHLSRINLRDVFNRMIKALKPDGHIYTSFKYGTFEGYRNGRYFTDFTEKTLKDFIKEIPKISILEQWVSEDVRKNRSGEKWLNLIFKMTDGGAA